MAQFHMDRLQQDGFMPVSFAGATHSVAHGHVPHVVHADPEQEAVDAYDRPHFLPHEAPEPEYHELSDGGSDATVSPPASPREPVTSVARRVAGAGFEVASNVAGSTAQYRSDPCTTTRWPGRSLPDPALKLSGRWPRSSRTALRGPHRRLPARSWKWQAMRTRRPPPPWRPDPTPDGPSQGVPAPSRGGPKI